MALSAFDDKSAPPTPAAIKKVLGKTALLWVDAQRGIGERLGTIATEWGFSGKSTGWGLRVKRGDRIIAYLTPCDGHFLASFALGAAAVGEVKAARLPKHVRETLDTARKYAEGTGLRFKVATAGDAAAVVAIAEIKSRH